MGWYRRLIFDSFALPRSSILESISRTSFHTCSSKPIFSRSRISEISQLLLLQNGPKKTQRTSPFLDGAKRFYSEDHRQQVSNSKPMAYKRMEIEADCIGLLLVASAGYDPRMVPFYYLKMERVVGDWRKPAYSLTHPPGPKRAQFLTQSKVMEHALYIYREVQAGRQVEGFLRY